MTETKVGSSCGQHLPETVLGPKVHLLAHDSLITLYHRRDRNPYFRISRRVMIAPPSPPGLLQAPQQPSSPGEAPQTLGSRPHTLGPNGRGEGGRVSSGGKEHGLFLREKSWTEFPIPPLGCGDRAGRTEPRRKAGVGYDQGGKKAGFRGEALRSNETAHQFGLQPAL